MDYLVMKNGVICGRFMAVLLYRTTVRTTTVVHLGS